MQRSETNTQRFEGAELEPLLARVREELGADVRIVEANRVLRGGVAGFFAKECFEVVAEVPEGVENNRRARANRARHRRSNGRGTAPEARAAAAPRSSTSATAPSALGWDDELVSPVRSFEELLEQASRAEQRFADQELTPAATTTTATATLVAESVTVERAAATVIDATTTTVGSAPATDEAPVLRSWSLQELLDPEVDAFTDELVVPTAPMQEPSARRATPAAMRAYGDRLLDLASIEDTITTAPPAVAHAGSVRLAVGTEPAISAETASVLLDLLAAEDAAIDEDRDTVLTLETDEPVARMVETLAVAAVVATPTIAPIVEAPATDPLVVLGFAADQVAEARANATAATDVGAATMAALDLLLRAVPSAPALPSGPGNVLAIVGRFEDAWAEAVALAGDEGTVLLASPRAERRAPRGARLFRAAETLRRHRDALVTEATGTVVVVIEAGMRREDAVWAARVLEAVAPLCTLAVADATSNADDVAAWEHRLGAIDALTVLGIAETVRPAALLGCGIPVARVEGAPAGRAQWSAVLADRLEATVRRGGRGR